MRYTNADVQPQALEIRADEIPSSLRQIPQWVVWRWIWNPRRGQWDKPPRRPDGGPGSSTNPETWSLFQDALTTCLEKPWDGLGFVLTEECGVVGVDLDDCRDPQTGRIDDWALEILKRLSTYVEASPSGTGCRAFCFAQLPGAGRKRGAIEVYSEGRYLTVTGQRLGRFKALQDRQTEVEELWQSLASPERPSAPLNQRPSVLAMSDFELLERARGAQNGVKFWHLFNGQIDGHPSRSEADLALCCHLAFWTERDARRIDQFFRASGLMRAKWDERRGEETYGEVTVQKAIELTTETFGSRPQLSIVRPSPSGEDEAELNVHGATQQHLVLRTYSELLKLPAADVTWICERFLAEGGITELSAWVKAGKSTLAAQLVAAVLKGTPFLELYEVEQGPVVLLTEERHSSIRAVLEEAGVEEDDPLHISMWHEQRGLPWEQAVAEAATEGKRIGARLLLIDTLGRWAGVEDENDASAADRAMAPVQQHAVGLAVCVLRQAGKSMRETQNAGRGSSAYSGSADILINLRHHRNDKGQIDETEPTRWLHIVSRFERDLVPPMRLTYRDRRYHAVEATRVDGSVSDRILEDLGRYGPSTPVAITERTELNRASVRGTLRRLVYRQKVAENDGTYSLLQGPVTPLLHPVTVTGSEGLLHPPAPLKGAAGEVQQAPLSAAVAEGVTAPARCPACGREDYTPLGNNNLRCVCGRVYRR